MTLQKVPEDYHEQQFPRLMKYAVFVRRLTIDLAVMTTSERSFLVGKAAKQDLLPKLEVLKISGELFGTDPGWGQGEHCQNLEHAEHLTLLFVAKSLKTLAVSYRHVLGIAFGVVSSRCPNLRDLRLGYCDSWVGIYHPFPIAGYIRDQPTKEEGELGYVSSRRLQLIDGIADWAFLSHLTIYVNVSPAVDLAELCRLPALESLTVFAPRHFTRNDELDQWVRRQGKFPSLHELVVKGCSPAQAKPVFSCKYLLEQLQCLRWHPNIWSGFEKDFEDVMQQLSHNAVVLEKLYIYSTLTTDALMSWRHLGKIETLSELHIMTDHLGHEKWTYQCCSALAGVSKQLKKLALNCPLPISMLPDIVATFPFVTHWRFWLDNDAWQGSPGSPALIRSPDNVIVEVVHTEGPPEEKHAFLGNLERQVEIMV